MEERLTLLEIVNQYGEEELSDNDSNILSGIEVTLYTSNNNKSNFSSGEYIELEQLEYNVKRTDIGDDDNLEEELSDMKDFDQADNKEELVEISLGTILDYVER